MHCGVLSLTLEGFPVQNTFYINLWTSVMLFFIQNFNIAASSSITLRQFQFFNGVNLPMLPETVRLCVFVVRSRCPYTCALTLYPKIPLYHFLSYILFVQVSFLFYHRNASQSGSISTVSLYFIPSSGR